MADQIPNRILRHYGYQVVRRTVEYGGTFESVVTGLSRGCPLSSWFAALSLRGLDDKLSRCGVFYVRYRDAILILTQTRWQLRRAMKCLNQAFNALKIKKHPAKTQIGRIAQGFDFLGYRFGGENLHLADKTVRKHVERLLRLYEQQANKKVTPLEVACVLGDYVKRWRRWCRAGLSNLAPAVDDDVSAESTSRINLLPLTAG
jgi:RNA-directed DNA polymerase